MNPVKVRGLLASWIFLASLACLLMAALYIHEILALYPADHLASYGPRVPRVAKLYAGLLPHAPAGLLAAAAASVAFWFLHRRSAASPDAKAFARALIAALGIFLAFFSTMILLIAYFYLPKIANAV